MDQAEVDRWLREYVGAWKSCDRDRIGELLAEDVEYRFHPYDEPVRGRAALVRTWLGEEEHPGAPAPDEPGTFDAAYRTVAVDGDVAVATGSSTYWTKPGGALNEVFDNCFVMRFDSAGRCREFTEWYIRRPAAPRRPAHPAERRPAPDRPPARGRDTIRRSSRPVERRTARPRPSPRAIPAAGTTGGGSG